MSYLGPNEKNKYLTPINAINCSSRNFLNFPIYLPQNTSIIYLSNNKIENLNSLRLTIYRDVSDIYLDNNFIDSIDDLESILWLQNFRILSIKGNKLTKIPIYALRNALQKNLRIGKLYLSHNPWRCDCSFVPKFQEILQQYHSIIKDIDNITCKYVEGDNLFTRKVLTLQRSEVCKLPTENKIHPLDLLNGILASLIVLILSKLGYDYFRYRRYGKVPWIVSKMP